MIYGRLRLFPTYKKVGLKEGGKDRPSLRRNGSACSDWRNTQLEGVKFYAQTPMLAY